MKILAGTSKGLVIWEKINGNWELTELFFQGLPVAQVYADPITSYWWVSITHRHWGQKLHFSADQGQSWQQLSPPQYPEDAQLPSGKRATLKKIWSFQQKGLDKDKGLWLGTEPGGLFHSSQSGEAFHLVEALWNHPSRIDANQWFGAGRDHPFIHSILTDPRDEGHVYVGVSCAGVFETRDGGKSWQPKNKGLVAAYLPNPQAEVGHDPHAMKICQQHPHVIWQQNHCGIFRSTDGGDNWVQLSQAGETPHYGFALAIDHVHPERAWVIPAKSDEERIADGLQLKVYRTEDGGKSWQALTQGLPQNHAFDIVFRHSLASMGDVLVFGSTTGNLFVSEDGGDDWQLLSNYLARVDSVLLIP